MSDDDLRRDVAELASELVRRRSITPDDAGCQALIDRKSVV